jgi:integrase
MDRTEDWERCLLAEADQQLRCVSHLLVPTSAAVADARIALAASRLCGEQGVLIRATLHCDKALKLPLPASPGRPYSAEEKTRMLEEAQKLGTPQMHAALALDLNTGLWDKELREIRWEQIDLVHKKALTVGKSKTEAGTGRVIPLNETAIAALEAHAAWYIRRFGECKPEWFVFPAGKGQPNDPTKPITTLRTAWAKVHDKAKVVGRWHDIVVLG